MESTVSGGGGKKKTLWDTCRRMIKSKQGMGREHGVKLLGTILQTAATGKAKEPRSERCTSIEGKFWSPFNWEKFNMRCKIGKILFFHSSYGISQPIKKEKKNMFLYKLVLLSNKANISRNNKFLTLQVWQCILTNTGSTSPHAFVIKYLNSHKMKIKNFTAALKSWIHWNQQCRPVCKEDNSEFYVNFTSNWKARELSEWEKGSFISILTCSSRWTV